MLGQPKLNSRQEAHLVELLRSGEYSTPNSVICSALPDRRSTAPSPAARRQRLPVELPPLQHGVHIAADRQRWRH
jgi:hypothetical protein